MRSSFLVVVCFLGLVLVVVDAWQFKETEFRKEKRAQEELQRQKEIEDAKLSLKAEDDLNERIEWFTKVEDWVKENRPEEYWRSEKVRMERGLIWDRSEGQDEFSEPIFQSLRTIIPHFPHPSEQESTNLTLYWGSDKQLTWGDYIPASRAMHIPFISFNPWVPHDLYSLYILDLDSPTPILPTDGVKVLFSVINIFGNDTSSAQVNLPFKAPLPNKHGSHRILFALYPQAFTPRIPISERISAHERESSFDGTGHWTEV